MIEILDPNPVRGKEISSNFQGPYLNVFTEEITLVSLDLC